MSHNPSYEKDSGFNDIDLEERPGLYKSNLAPERARTPDFTPAASYRQATADASAPPSYGTPGRSYRFATDEVPEDQAPRVNFSVPNGHKKTSKAGGGGGASKLVCYILLALVVLFFILTLVFIILYATVPNPDAETPRTGAASQTDPTTQPTTLSTTTVKQTAPGVVIGQVQGQDVYKYMLDNSQGAKVELISLGARINRFMTLGGVDVVPGFESTAGDNATDLNLFSQYPWGAVESRLCGVTGSENSFNFAGETITPMSAVYKMNFAGRINPDNTVTFTKQVTKADDGLPGSVTIEVTYKLTEDNSLEVMRKATGTGSSDSLIDLCSSMKFNVYGNGNATNTYIMLNSDVNYDNGEWGNLGSGLQNFAQSISIQPLIDSVLGQNGNARLSRTYRVKGANQLKYVGSLKTAPGVNPSVTIGMYSSHRVLTLSMDIAENSQLSVTGKNGQVYQRLSFLSVTAGGRTPGPPGGTLLSDLILREGEIYESMDVYKLV